MTLTSPSLSRGAVFASLVGCVASLLAGAARAEFTISEFLARSSDQSLRDSDGVPADWIEIHNPDGAERSLSGYFLTDNAQDLTKWEFPDVSVPAGGYLVVFASGKDRFDPGAELHTNFSLNGGGEYLALVAPDGSSKLTEFTPEYPRQYENISFGLGVFGAPTRQTWVERDASGRFHIPTDGALGDSWRNPPGSGAGEFDDSGWAPFTGGVGFESTGGTLEPLVTTNISSEMRGVNATGYFRYPFNFDAADKQVSSIVLNVQIDDGFVAYLNGERIGDLKAPSPIEWNSVALSSPSRSDTTVLNEVLTYDATSAHSALRDGLNVLAIQGMNSSSGGSDFVVVAELIADVLDTGSGLQLGFMTEPSPGAPNNAVVNAPPSAVVFSHTTQAFTDPLSLTLSVDTPGATIRYTTDGSLPTDDINNPSPAYSGPISIDDTTQVRARAFLPGSLPAATQTHGYFHLTADAMAFTSDLPIVLIDSFGKGQPFETGSTDRRPMMMAIWEPQGEPNPRASMANPPDLVTRIGARKRGSSSGGWPKYAMSIEGWGEQDWEEQSFAPLGFAGDDDWILSSRYQFDRALMRNPLIYQLSRDIGRYAARSKFVELFNNVNGGEISFNNARGTEYFGVYDFMEKLDRSKDRIDVERLDASIDSEPEITGGYIVKNDRADPGEPTLPVQGIPRALVHVYPDGGPHPERPDDFFITPAQKTWLQNYLNEVNAAVSAPNGIHPSTGLHFTDYIDVDSFIDHIWLNALMMNVDWGRLSAWMFKPRNGKLNGGPIWDFDRSAGSEDSRDNNPIGWNPSGDSRVWYDGQYPWFGKALGFFSNTDNPSSQLSTRPDQFQQAVDRWFELRKGEFSKEHIEGTIDAMADELREAQERNFIRWAERAPNGGQYSGGISGWEGEVAHLKGWLDQRVNWIDAQFFQPPTFNHSGGVVEAGFQLTMNSNDATVYYTLDGSDPRAPGGGIKQGAVPFDGGPVDDVLLPEDAMCQYFVPLDASLEGTWFGKDFDDAGWFSGTSGLGFESATGVLNAEIATDIKDKMQPSANGLNNASCYFRYEFDFDNADSINRLVLEMKYDDGFVAYLNGTEVARSSSAPASVGWNSDSSSGPSDSTITGYTFNGQADNNLFDFDISAFKHLVENGRNVLAIQGMNSSSGGSDFLIKPRLSVNHTVVATPIVINESVSVVARAHDGQEWSAPTTANFVVGGELADATNLVVAEIMYNPVGPTPAELGAGFTDGDQFEYLQLQNISGAMVDLKDVVFDRGIDFEFLGAPVTTLEPGARVIIVSDLAAFRQRYGNGFDSRIAGEFGNDTNLSNGGERLALSGAAGTIRDFSYNDRYPWPESADGDGPSAVLIAPASNPEHSLGTNWRASVGALGSLAGSDSVPFSGGDPDADADGDGLSAFAEHAFGTSDTDPSGSILRATFAPGGALHITFPRNLAADDAVVAIEVSADLDSWMPAGEMFDLRSETHNGDGTATFTFEADDMLAPSGGEWFVRLRVSER